LVQGAVAVIPLSSGRSNPEVGTLLPALLYPSAEGPVKLDVWRSGRSPQRYPVLAA